MIKKSKKISLEKLRTHFRDGMSILSGGFMGIGAPPNIIKAILDSGVRNLTIISSDTAKVNFGIGVLIAEKRVKKVIASHIGTNLETGRQMIAGEIEVELVPQGTFVERIRCGGAGLGGVLTPTGVGTKIEDGKDKLIYDGVTYLVERPLRADMAIINAYCADEAGNLIYRRAARNFNPIMAFASDYVVAEVEEIYPTGKLDPDHIITPGILIDAIVVSSFSKEN